MSKTKIEQYPNSLMTISKILSDRMFKDTPAIEKARKINKIERDAFYKNKEQAKDNVDEFLNKLYKVDSYITELTQYLDITATDLDRVVDEQSLTNDEIKKLEEKYQEYRRQERLDEQRRKEEDEQAYESSVSGTVKTTGSAIKGRRRKMKGGARSDSSLSNSGSSSSRSSGSSSRLSFGSPMSSIDSSLSSSSSSQDRLRQEANRRRIENLAEKVRKLNQDQSNSTTSPLILPQYGRYDAFGDELPPEWESVSELTDGAYSYKNLANDNIQYSFILVVLTKILDEINNLNIFYKSKIFKKAKDISIFDLELVNNELIKLYTQWKELLLIFESYPNIKVDKIINKINVQFSKLYLLTRQLNPSLSVSDAQKQQFEISVADKLAKDKQAYNDYRNMRIERSKQELEDQGVWELRSNDMSNYYD